MDKNESAKEQKVPSDYSKAITNALSIMRALAVAMDQETEMVGKTDVEALSKARLEKAKLIRDYRASLAPLMQNPVSLKEASEETRAQLKKIAEMLAVSTKKNMDTLKIAVTATQSLVMTIMNAARAQTNPIGTYSDPRKASAKADGYGSICSPVAVSRTA